MVHLSPIQHFLGNQVSSALAQKFGTKVSVGRVDVGFFNRIIIDDVMMYDQKGDSMLYASRISSSTFISKQPPASTTSNSSWTLWLQKTPPSTPHSTCISVALSSVMVPSTMTRDTWLKSRASSHPLTSVSESYPRTSSYLI